MLVPDLPVACSALLTVHFMHELVGLLSDRVSSETSLTEQLAVNTGCVVSLVFRLSGFNCQVIFLLITDDRAELLPLHCYHAYPNAHTSLIRLLQNFLLATASASQSIMGADRD